MESFDRLVDIMATLRGPQGCPWDRAQTPQSLRPYLLEETHEVLEQLDQPDSAKLAEELGDLLLQVVFHAQLAREAGQFDMADVCRGIVEKLIRRHPHVFGDETGVDEADDVLGVWERAKRAEAGHETRPSVLDGVPRALPALARAQALQAKAAKVGFDWPNQVGRLAKVAEELAELDEARASTPERAADEFGDLLFAVVNVGRGLGLSCEDSLRSATAKFERRFRAIEVAAGGREALARLDLDEQDALWDEVKRGEAHAQAGSGESVGG